MDQVISQLIRIVGTVSVTLVVYVLLLIFNRIARKLKLEKARIAEKVIYNIISTIVGSINQTDVNFIKDIQKRKLKENDIKCIKNKAKQQISLAIDNKLKKDMKPIAKKLEQYCDCMIENEVRLQKIKVDKKNKIISNLKGEQNEYSMG